jgi:hypothetical protein
MTEQDKEQLLNELFGGEELEQTRGSTLAFGLREMRGRRRRRALTRAAIVVLPLVLLGLAVFPFTSRSPQRLTEAKPVALVSKPQSEIEYITSEQLFAMFPNRPLALVGKAGHQRLVFLDEHPVAKNSQ